MARKIAPVPTAPKRSMWLSSLTALLFNILLFPTPTAAARTNSLPQLTPEDVGASAWKPLGQKALLALTFLCMDFLRMDNSEC